MSTAPTAISPTGSGGLRSKTTTGGVTPLPIESALRAACSARTSLKSVPRPAPTSGALKEDVKGMLVDRQPPAVWWCRPFVFLLERQLHTTPSAAPTSSSWAAKAARGSGRAVIFSGATNNATGTHRRGLTPSGVCRSASTARDAARALTVVGVYCEHAISGTKMISGLMTVSRAPCDVLFAMDF